MVREIKAIKSGIITASCNDNSSVFMHW
jgi:hypothetical protein